MLNEVNDACWLAGWSTETTIVRPKLRPYTQPQQLHDDVFVAFCISRSPTYSLLPEDKYHALFFVAP
jgi:hypothetical protein